MDQRPGDSFPVVDVVGPDRPSLDAAGPPPDAIGPPPRDQQAPDAAADPCVYGVVELTYPNGKMVICLNAGNAMDLCHIGVVCNSAGGWQLCPPADYLANGGASTPQPLPATLGGCIRDNGTLTAPTPGICSSCGYGAAATAEIAWTCSSSAASSGNGAYVGLMTYATCNRVGVNTPSTAGYWAPLGPSATHTRVVCCR